MIVTTIDREGRPHSSCKGLVKINKNGKAYLLDLYFRRTFENLKHNPNISLTVFDEHKFKGYCLKGKAQISGGKKPGKALSRAWEEMIAARLTQRILKNVRGEKGHSRHPESLLPSPRYLIAVAVEEVIDLTPAQLKEGA